MGFVDLEKACNIVNRKALWEVLRNYDVGSKLLNGIKSMYVNSQAYVRVKGGESECFRINIGLRQRFIMSPCLFNVYMDVVTKEVKGMGRRGVRFQEEGTEWRFPSLLYADDLVLCDESEEDLRAIVGCFIEMCRRRSLKINAGKSKVIMLSGEEGLECEVYVDGICLEQSRNLNTWDMFWMNQVLMRQSVVGRRQVGGLLQVLLGLWLMLGICTSSVLVSCMSH